MVHAEEVARGCKAQKPRDMLSATQYCCYSMKGSERAALPQGKNGSKHKLNPISVGEIALLALRAGETKVCICRARRWSLNRSIAGRFHSAFRSADAAQAIAGRCACWAAAEAFLYRMAHQGAALQGHNNELVTCKSVSYCHAITA